VGAGCYLFINIRNVAMLTTYFVVLLDYGGASASPWAKADNALLIISRANYFNADLTPTSAPDGTIENRFQRIDSNTYIEFGLTDEVTIGGKAVFGTSWLMRGTDIETATGFSEVEVFGQYQFYHSGKDVSAVRIAASRPSNFSSGARPELQSDGADIDASILYGRNLLSRQLKIFAAIDAGYRKRFGQAADQVRLQTTLGVEPGKHFLLLIDTFATLSLRNEEVGGADFDIVKIQPSALWRISNRWGVQAGVTEEVYGRNISLGRTYFIGIWSSF
jgi:hypothetical protein